MERIIEDFVGLRAKLFSHKMLKGKEERNCTVIKKAEIKKTITLEDYRE